MIAQFSRQMDLSSTSTGIHQPAAAVSTCCQFCQGLNHHATAPSESRPTAAAASASNYSSAFRARSSYRSRSVVDQQAAGNAGASLRGKISVKPETLTEEVEAWSEDRADGGVKVVNVEEVTETKKSSVSVPVSER
jgi:hypothetical protein